MKLEDIISVLSLEVLQLQGNFSVDVSGGYASDMLSDVLAHGREKNLWITFQTHQNVVAVAKLKDLAAVIFVQNRTPDEETLKRAREENVILLGTADSAFEISGKLYGLIMAKD
jgi:hypothetical protein